MTPFFAPFITPSNTSGRCHVNVNTCEWLIRSFSFPQSMPPPRGSDFSYQSNRKRRSKLIFFILNCIWIVYKNVILIKHTLPKKIVLYYMNRIFEHEAHNQSVEPILQSVIAWGPCGRVVACNTSCFPDLWDSFVYCFIKSYFSPSAEIIWIILGMSLHWNLSSCCQTLFINNSRLVMTSAAHRERALS